MTTEATCMISGNGIGRSGRRLWRLALLLSLAALMSGVLLTATSVWFLGAVAIAGAGPAAFAFNFHVPAAFVRLFAMSRTAARYGERVVGHQAALADQVARRSRLLLAMAAAPGVRSAGWQLARQDRLNDYIEDVEDVDYARLRVGLPLAGLAIGFSLLAVLTLAVVPLALLPVSALAVAAWLASRNHMRSLHHDWRAARKLQRGASTQFGRALSAVVPLRAEGLWSQVLDGGFERLRRAEDRQQRFCVRLARMEIFPQLAGPVSALSVLLCAWQAGMGGNALLPAAFVAFGWLALGEGAAGLSRAAAGHVRRGAADASLRKWVAEEQHAAATAAGDRRSGLEVLAIDDLPRTTPDGRPLAGPISLECRKGRAIALTGPSGSGKTTLLKQIAGWLPVQGAGRILADGKTVDRQEITHLGLHDAAILADTVRENLFSARPDAACWEALEAVELDGRILAGGGLDAWITQDRLSLGEAQRLNLARAWLSDAPIVLLDEPTEHIDGAQANRILKRLTERFAGRIFIYSTHRRTDSTAEMDSAAIDLR